MNILITGSSGYIGSNFVDTFEEKYDFFKFLLQKNSIDTLNLESIDIILHCAALVHQKVEQNYETYDDVNVKYPIALAKKAKESGVYQFIFISTIAVYGDDQDNIDENTLCSPVTPYGKSKLEAERQLQELSDNNFIVSIIRPPMVYGKDAPGNIASLVKLVSKVPVLPFGNICNKRSFIYIDNLIYLINRVIEQKQSGTFLASDDQPLSTTRLIELIAKYQQKNLMLLKVPFFSTLLQKVKPLLYQRLYGDLVVDSHHAREVLVFKNPYTEEEGIKLMLKESSK